jgi:hypothetical protein
VTGLKGDSLFPIRKFPSKPVPVYVARILSSDAVKQDMIRLDEFEVFGWAELYPSEVEASAKMTYEEASLFGRKLKDANGRPRMS